MAAPNLHSLHVYIAQVEHEARHEDGGDPVPRNPCQYGKGFAWVNYSHYSRDQVHETARLRGN